MRGKCWERFPRHRPQRKQLVSDPGMHHGTCATHVPWCMSGSLTHGARENVPGIPDACATRDFTNLARGPWNQKMHRLQFVYKLIPPPYPCISHWKTMRRQSNLTHVIFFIFILLCLYLTGAVEYCRIMCVSMKITAVGDGLFFHTANLV